MASSAQPKGLAVITGASTGIGYHLAQCAGADGYDLLVIANEPAIESAAQSLRASSGRVDALETNLSTPEGVDKLMEWLAADGRSVDILMANAGVGFGNDFLDQDIDDVFKVVDTNIRGTLDVIHRIGNQMRSSGSGRILITGSIAGFVPGSYMAVYNASKSFLNSFSFALRNELQDSGVTVTCLMPGATETPFFERGGLLNTAMGQSKKDDPADVAQKGYKALMAGEGDTVTGLTNKVMSSLANIIPAGFLAEMQAKVTKPGSGKDA
ncbi:SDR family NAD(P)-dependent oxidoreductase [Oryzifoliimicrobium ureilyticus]|uniref:SDR family NAD(P)-dependent oxidoreductase n=1 Tax=Oryzifoliimicrobium ureilyticus TaxID=3113724 RepID=UPI003076713F